MEELKKIITGLLVSSPLQATVGILDRDYAEQIGERIPFRRHGFSTLENCLRCMPDVLEVIGHGPNAQVVLYVSNKSAHINDLVTKQRTNPPKRGPRFGAPQRIRHRRRSLAQRNPITPQPRPQLIPLMSTPISPPFAYMQQRTRETPPRFSKNKGPINNVLPVSPIVKCYPKHDTDTLSVPQNGTIPKQNDLSVLSAVEIDSDTSLDEDIYMSDTDDESLIIDTSLDNCSTHYYSLTSNAIHKPNHEPTKIETNVPLRVQTNLKTLISKYDDGIWCGSLPEKYKEMFGNELDYMEYGYRGLINMCLELTDIFHCIRPDTGDYKLYNKQKPLPKDFDKSFQISKILKHFNEHDNFPATEPALIDPEEFVDKSFVYPDNVLQLNDEIPRQFLPSGVKEDDFINVSVGEVYDPSKFWVLLYTHSEELDDMMDEIQSFYNSKDANYDIPEHMITTGLYCVAMYNSEYHRTIIVNTLKSVKRKVKVFYVDYGTVASVNQNTLKFLHRKFADFPQQAIRARLASIYPLIEKTQWPVEASNRFLQLVSTKVLVAHIHKIDYERQILEIFLADTSGADDIYMNDMLVAEGYALFTNQEQEKVTLDPEATPWVKQIHKFPTFIEIEQGAVPSADEMAKLLLTGMPIEQIYPRYFCQESTKQDELFSNEMKDMEFMTQDQNACKRKQNYFSPDEIKGERTSFETKCSNTDSLSSIKEKMKTKRVDVPVVEDNATAQYSDLILATSATKPPPGFQNVIPSHSFSTTTRVALDPAKNAIVTQTTNQTGSNVDYLALILANQNYGTSNVSPLHPKPPITFPPIQHATPSPNPYITLLEHISNSQIYQNPVSTLLFNQLNYLQQQNCIYSNSHSPRATLQLLIYQNLLETSNSLMKFVQFLLYRQSSPSFVSQNYLYNYVIANARSSPLLRDSNYNNGLYELLNIMSDLEIMELFEFLNRSTDLLSTPATEAPPTVDYLSNKFQQLNTHSNIEDLRPTRRLVIKAEIKNHKFHVIWHNQEAHINMEELLTFIGNKAPIEQIRRQILMQDTILTIIDIPLSSHEKLYHELSRLTVVNKSDILHVISASSIPKILPLLNHKFQQLEFADLFDKISPNSDLWFRN